MKTKLSIVNGATRANERRRISAVPVKNVTIKASITAIVKTTSKATAVFILTLKRSLSNGKSGFF
jgi:hypothetical protein